MIYTIDAIKIPGTIEKVKEVELPDGAIPLKFCSSGKSLDIPPL